MKLNRENYKSILNMLNAKDEADNVVGLTCIENADFKTNYMLILFLYKESNCTNEAWLKNAPKTFNKIIKIAGGKDKFMTYKIIFDYMIKKKFSTEDAEFYMQNYNNFLVDMINKSDKFPKIEKIEIKLKDLDYEGRTISQG